MRIYKTPELSVHPADAFSDQLSPVAELGYPCLEDVVLDETGSGIAITVCVDREQWPMFDGSGIDEILIRVQDGSGSGWDTEIGFGTASGYPIWCGTEFQSVPSNGVYTVTIRLVIDDETVCSEQREVTVDD